MIVLLIVLAEGTPILVRQMTALPSGTDAIVFARPRPIANQLIWLPIILVMLLYAVLATVKKTTAALIAVALLLVSFGAIAYLTWYRPFTAIDFRESRVHLHYLWPRPVVTVEARDVISIGEILSQDPGSSDFLYRLQLETTNGDYASMANGAQTNITTAKTRLRALNPKIVIRDAPLW